MPFHHLCTNLVQASITTFSVSISAYLQLQLSAQATRTFRPSQISEGNIARSPPKSPFSTIRSMAPSTVTRKHGEATRPLLTLAVLAAVLAFAVDAMFIQLERNGYMESVRPLIHEHKLAFLPGTTRPILRHYTGIAALDQIFVTANVFWANIVDGTLPECTLYALQFAGQLPAIIILLLVESRRVAGAHALLRSAVAWGVAMQSFGFGVIMPLYALLYLTLPRSDPTSADAAKLRQPIQLHGIIPAFVIGYFVPTAFLVYPYEDAALSQRANIVWQYFPVYVVAIIEVFTWASKRVSIGQNINTPSQQLSRNALDHAYGFAFAVAALCQWVTYSAMIAAVVIPDELPSGVASRFTPTRLFVPRSPHSFAAMESHSTAIHDFLKYDQFFGSAAIALWALVLSQEAGVRRVSLSKFLRDVVFFGPAAAATNILWTRDEALLEKAN
ncbi:Epoxide hydrolase aurD [Paramyrothecium foliicola]|nr:Epoxide hydrolase aurD [Paramyrothecium foliicola]